MTPFSPYELLTLKELENILEILIHSHSVGLNAADQQPSDSEVWLHPLVMHLWSFLMFCRI